MRFVLDLVENAEVRPVTDRGKWLRRQGDAINKEGTTEPDPTGGTTQNVAM